MRTIFIAVTMLLALMLVGVGRAEVAPSPTPPAPPHRRAPIRLEGFIQVQSNQGSLMARSRQTTDSPLLAGISDIPAITNLEIRRLTVGLQGGLAPDVNFKITGFYATRLGAPRLNDAYIEARLPQRMHLLAGQFLTRFGMEGVRPAMHHDIIEISDATVALYGFRDLGVSVEGQLFGHARDHVGRVTYDLGLFNGEGQTVTRVGMRDVIGRLQVVAMPHLTLGFSFMLGRTSPAGDQLLLPASEFDIDTERGFVPRSTTVHRALPVRTYGGLLSFQQGRWALRSEYLWAHGYNRFSRADTRAAGGYARVVYTASPSIDLLADYDRFDPDLDRINTAQVDNATNARTRTVLGLNYFLDRATAHKFMVDYEWHREIEGPALRYSGYRARYQFRF